MKFLLLILSYTSFTYGTEPAVTPFTTAPSTQNVSLLKSNLENKTSINLDSIETIQSILNPPTKRFFIKLGYEILKDIQVNRFDCEQKDYFSMMMNESDIEKLDFYLYAPNASMLEPTLWINSLWKADETTQKRQSYLTAIIAITWALVHKGSQQNELFERGSYKLIDQNHKIETFLKGYVDLAKFNYGYERDPRKGRSSHYVNHSPESQFGIDVRFSSNQGVMKLLPFDHTHILFGKINFGQMEDLTFFKLEPIGTANFASLVAHGANAAIAQVETVQRSWRREKDVSPCIRELYQTAMTGVPTDKPAKTVHEMYTNILQKLGDDEAQIFKRAIEKLLKLNKAHIRTGNEVILEMH
jgi:hypothetical protein